MTFERATWYRFPAPVVLSVSGKDSTRYLNARLSNDSRSLLPSNSMVAAALTAQGRVEGLFLVFCVEPLTYLLVCDGGDGGQVEMAFRRFIVADRVSVIRGDSQYQVFHICGDGAEQIACSANRFGGVYAPIQRVVSKGYDIVIPKSGEDSFGQQLCGLPSLTTDQYHFERARFGAPSFPEELNDGVMLSECGMKHAISFSKGCYVGQEVIERSDAIGRIPRKLERIVLNIGAVVASGEAVKSVEGEDVGKIVSCYSHAGANRTILFALLRSGRYAEGQDVLVGEKHGRVVLAGEFLS